MITDREQAAHDVWWSIWKKMAAMKKAAYPDFADADEWYVLEKQCLKAFREYRAVAKQEQMVPA